MAVVAGAMGRADTRQSYSIFTATHSGIFGSLVIIQMEEEQYWS